MAGMKSLFTLLDRWLKRIVNLSAGISAGIVFIMMFPISVDVILRYAFNKPLHGTYQLAEFMMVGAVYLSIAYVQLHREHIRLELATSWMHPKYQLMLDIFGQLIGMAIFSIIAWQSGIIAWQSWITDDYTMGIVEWPLWPAKVAVSYGSGLLVLQILSDTVRDSIKLIENRYEAVNPGEKEGPS